MLRARRGGMKKVCASWLLGGSSMAQAAPAARRSTKRGSSSARAMYRDVTRALETRGNNGHRGISEAAAPRRRGLTLGILSRADIARGSRGPVRAIKLIS